MKRGPRSLRGRDAPAPTPCVPAECFDLLVRHCVACGLLRTPRPKPAAPASSPAPRTALQPQESVGAGTGEAALSLPGLLFGAPALLGLALVLALVLVGLVSWRRRQRRLRGASSAEAPDGDKDKDGLWTQCFLSQGPVVCPTQKTVATCIQVSAWLLAP
ncbi:tumor necrosis factor receptor superfamily member 13C isoform X3 [Papio anubis]|uniref:tumor necrosis factor receptor superfamily member 13C isoform X3 n=1 Tax=Papio anubis TaxID=9555 RepID=UPI000B7AFA31|nr:tumor necrosis factor receptor superfamily member 13C isoform X3 [Papio anubis]XP_021777307.1 tumor necrosis factor receptor superfamily member 13C isoform X3 [Papio anubis]